MIGHMKKETFFWLNWKHEKIIWLIRKNPQSIFFPCTFGDFDEIKWGLGSQLTRDRQVPSCLIRVYYVFLWLNFCMVSSTVRATINCPCYSGKKGNSRTAKGHIHELSLSSHLHGSFHKATFTPTIWSYPFSFSNIYPRLSKSIILGKKKQSTFTRQSS